MTKILLATLLLAFCVSCEDGNGLKTVLSTFSEWSDVISGVVSVDCKKSLLHLKRGISERKTWAFEMLDASAKIPAGILEGNFVNMGSYHECTAVATRDEHGSIIRGTYYILAFNTTSKALNIEKLSSLLKTVLLVQKRYFTNIHILLSRFQFDVCIPSTCSPSDLQAIVSAVTADVLEGYGLELTVNQKVYDDFQITKSMVFALITFSILGVTLALGTARDLYLRLVGRQFCGHLGDQILQSFSLYSNSLKILKIDESRGQFAFLDGIRVIANLILMYLHVYSVIVKPLVGNVSEFDGLLNFLTKIYLGFTALSVDTFIFLSGFLIMYFHQLSVKRKIGTGITSTIFSRYWRLSCPYLLCLLFLVLWPLVGSGPRWHLDRSSVARFSFKNCLENCWLNLLYISNYNFQSREMCLYHGWYLSVDMQLFILSSLIIMPLFRKPSRGILGCWLLIIGSWFFYAALAYNRNFPAVVLLEGILMPKRGKSVFIQTPYRFGPYFIGILAAFKFANQENICSTKRSRLIHWSIFISTMVVAMADNYVYHDEISALWNATWFALRSSGWAVGLSSLTFLCATGNGGIVNSILSWNQFAPFSRLSFMTYLTHNVLFLAYYGSARGAQIYSHVTLAVTSVGLLTLSYLVAFVASVSFEAPFIALGKVLFSKKRNVCPEIVENENRHEDGMKKKK